MAPGLDPGEAVGVEELPASRRGGGWQPEVPGDAADLRMDLHDAGGEPLEFVRTDLVRGFEESAQRVELQIAAREGDGKRGGERVGLTGELILRRGIVLLRGEEERARRNGGAQQDDAEGEPGPLPARRHGGQRYRRRQTAARRHDRQRFTRPAAQPAPNRFSPALHSVDPVRWTAAILALRARPRQERAFASRPGAGAPGCRTARHHGGQGGEGGLTPSVHSRAVRARSRAGRRGSGCRNPPTPRRCGRRPPGRPSSPPPAPPGR
ncbi:MAG: hypothetical protein BWX64_02825 [Acidobacteria bacterium ADurb.Bin051]|nr:MAG: hypothetical protein BWX64_02825 [Acidobacteria bacterium ADurb.Bin051]